MNKLLLFSIATLLSCTLLAQNDCTKYSIANTNSICNPTTWQPFIVRAGDIRFFADQVEFRENATDKTASLKGIGRDELWQPVQFDVTFKNKTITAPDGFPQLINCLQNTPLNTSAWTYYTSVSGSILYKEDTLVINSFGSTPAGLQIGLGANTQNDNDLGGYAILKGESKKQAVAANYEFAFKLVNPTTYACAGVNCDNDTQAPEFSNCPPNIFRATTEPTYIVSWIPPTATDNCSTPSVSSNYKPDDSFTTGASTVVTYTATDAKGNKSTCSFTVNVSKPVVVSTNPYCVSKSNIPWEEWIGEVALADLKNASDKSRDISGVPFVAGYSDFRDKTATLKQAKNYSIILTPGLSYAENPTNLYWRVWIDFNNDKDFDDAGELVFEKTNGNQSTSGNFTIPVTATIGTTMMRISAKKDAYPTPCENFERGEVEDYSIIIEKADPCDIDSKAPVFSNCPQNISLATIATSAVATWTAPTATDSCSTPTITSNFSSGLSFPVGKTDVIYTATDAKNNKSTCVFTITVIKEECPGDTEAPKFANCPQNMSLTTASKTAVATWTTPTVTDNCKLDIISSDYQSGQNFPIGSTTVTYTAKDIKNNTSTCSFIVNVSTAINGDIELSLTSNSTTYKKLTTINFRLTAKNKGITAVKDIKIQFKHPIGAANGGTATPSVGTWTEFCPNATLCFEWAIPQLDSGAIGTLDVPLFIQDIDTPLVAVAQLLASTPTDTSLGNNIATLTLKPTATTGLSSIDPQKANEITPVVIQSISPNLTEGVINVKLESIINRDIDFAVFNANGAQVCSEKHTVFNGDNQISFNFSELPSGVYWIVPKVGKGLRAPLKFVKM